MTAAAASDDATSPVEAAPNTPDEQAAQQASVGAEVVQLRPRQSLSAKISYAQHLAQSGLLPAQYKQKPANVLWATEYGEMLGLSPMAAITGIHVIEGKPTASAALISALVRRAGHKLRVTGNDQRATAQIIRKDDPDFTFESVWTIDRAKQAGLVNKDVWKKYPAAMLKARAITEAARDACEEALSGMHYTPEELGADNLDEEGMPIGQTTVEVGQPVPERNWDAEIAAVSEDAEKLRALWYEAKGAGRGDVQKKINAVVEGLKTKKVAEQKPAEQKPVEQSAAPAEQPPTQAQPDEHGVVDAEVVEDEPAKPEPEQKPQTPGKADIPELLRSLVAASEVGTIAGAIHVVKQRGGVLGNQDVSGMLIDAQTRRLFPAAVELGIRPRTKITLLAFAEKALKYVEENGYSVANGVAVAAEQVKEVS